MKRSPKLRHASLKFETLEPRRVMTAGLTAGLSKGVLSIVGTSGADQINLRQIGGNISIVGVGGSWAASKVKSIVANGGGGDDFISVNSFANGGNKVLNTSVTVLSGSGKDHVFLANERDIYFSGLGHQLQVAGPGAAKLDGANLNLTSTIAASLASGVLTVTGTTAADSIAFRQSSNKISIVGVSGSWSSTQVKSIVVNLQDGGDDYVSVDSIGNGGVQAIKVAVTVNSGNGADRVHVASGKDVTMSGLGHVLKVASNGTATLDGAAVVWNPPATLTGTAWEDHNGNGARDAGDQGLAGWHILINGVDRATTDASGNWSVANLAAGAYTVQEVSQSAWTQTGGTGGYSVNAASGATIGNLDFGDFRNISLSGVAWNDFNGNGVRDSGDQGLAGWHILVNGVDRAATDANGNWSVANLGPGSYAVQEVSQSGWTDTSGAAGFSVVATSGVAVGNLNFGDFQNSSPPSGTWFDLNVQDAALRSLGNTLYADSLIDRSDILSLFQDVESDGTVTATEMSDLTRIVNAGSLFGSLNYVDKLASYVVLGNSANSAYQGQALGNLSAGASATQLTNLVNKWFLGLDRPIAPYGYSLVAGTLFVNGASYADIHQGYLSNCGFLAGLAETARVNPNAITSMFIVNGDGTYTVRFYHDGIAEYVTADSYLPTNGGAFVYDLMGRSVSDPGNELWTAIAEKAFAQIGQMSWFGRDNSYASIQYMYAFMTMSQITGQSTVAMTSTAGSTSVDAFAMAFNAGKLICLATFASPPTSGIVGNHVYAVVGYDSATQTVTLFNPWGIQYGLTTLSWSQVQANFAYFDRTA